MSPRPCPECGTTRIGNRRGFCRECNRYAARTRSLLVTIFREEHPTLYDQCAALAAERAYRTTVERSQ